MVNRPGRGDRDSSRNKGFRYVPPTAADVKKMATARSSRYDSIFKPNFDVWKPKEGENAIRVLPPTWGTGYVHWGLEVWVHRNVGADNSMYLCLRKNEKIHKVQRCPICEAVKRMKHEGDVDEAKEIDVNNMFVCWIIDRDDKDNKPQLWGVPYTLNNAIMALTYNSRSGAVLAIATPDDGYDVIIHRVGMKLNTKYTPAIDREKTPLLPKRKDQEDLIAFVMENPVPDTLFFRDPDYLESIVNGDTESGDEEDNAEDTGEDNEEEEARESRGRGRRRDEEEDPEEDRSTGDEGEEDPVEDEAAEEEEEAREERGRSRRRDDDRDDRSSSRRSRRDDDEDPDDRSRDDEGEAEEPAEEEEEEPPRSRRSRDDRDERPTRRSRDDEEPPRNRRSREEAEEPAEEEEPPRSRRSRDREEDPPRRRPREEERSGKSGVARRTLSKDREEPPRRRR